MNILIAKAEQHEFAEIARLNICAYSEFADRVTSEAWQAMQANLIAVERLAQRADFLTARVSGELAGSVAYCPPGKSDPDIFPEDWASILLLAVSPRYRGRGVAKRLVNACVQFARDDHAQIIGLYTSELMTAAQRVYEAMGFRQDSEIPQRHGLRYWRYKLIL